MSPGLHQVTLAGAAPRRAVEKAVESSSERVHFPKLLMSHNSLTRNCQRIGCQRQEPLSLQSVRVLSPELSSWANQATTLSDHFLLRDGLLTWSVLALLLLLIGLWHKVHLFYIVWTGRRDIINCEASLVFSLFWLPCQWMSCKSPMHFW